MTSSFRDEQRGEISGRSRPASDLGSSMGTAVAGTILVAGITAIPERPYALAMVVLGLLSVAGLALAARVPHTPPASGTA